jgi:multicomponent Na+:H+ antiporter subunit F
VSELLLTAAVVLMATMGAGLVRVAIGPTTADRMMGAQLLGTTGAGVLLLLVPVLGAPALADVALVFALLAAVGVTAFTRGVRAGGSGSEGGL